MLNILLLAYLISLSSLVSSGGFAAHLCENGESICVVDSGCETVFSVAAMPGERLSYLRLSDLKLVFISSTRGLVEQDILTGEAVVLSEERTGAPWISSSGDLWYTRDGFLYRNGSSASIAVPAFSVSVEDDLVVFSNRNDDLHFISLVDGLDRTVKGYRFYSPTVLPGGDVIAPTLTGEIIYLPSDGSMMVVGNGEQPCWSTELGGLFYCVSEDDGHSVTSSDIWFVKPGEVPVQVTNTPDVFENRPACSGDLLWFLDSRTGVLDCRNLNDLFF